MAVPSHFHRFWWEIHLHVNTVPLQEIHHFTSVAFKTVFIFFSLQLFDYAMYKHRFLEVYTGVYDWCLSCSPKLEIFIFNQKCEASTHYLFNYCLKHHTLSPLLLGLFMTQISGLLYCPIGVRLGLYLNLFLFLHFRLDNFY